jgi:hypothetical protein
MSPRALDRRVVTMSRLPNDEMHVSVIDDWPHCGMGHGYDVVLLASNTSGGTKALPAKRG